MYAREDIIEMALGLPGCATDTPYEGNGYSRAPHREITGLICNITI